MLSFRAERSEAEESRCNNYQQYYFGILHCVQDDINKMSEEKKYPEAIIGALILNKEEKILLARGKKWGDRYAIPGGHIKQGEKIEEAVIREVKEETNLDIEIVSPLRFSESVFSKEF